MSDADATGRTTVPRAIRVGRSIVRFRGEADLVDRAMGSLAALEEPSVPRPSDVVIDVGRATRSTALPAPGTPPDEAVVFGTVDDQPGVRAPGIGTAALRTDGGLGLEIERGAPEGDAVAERLTIPALAERLRRERTYLIHAAILRLPSPSTGVALVPAARGGGKTTLSLSLRRHGWIMLSDDRGWLTGDPARAEVDPWPEAPRVGDRSLFLLPPHVAPGARDDRTAKAPVPALVPPRADRTFEVVGVLLPRLVAGRGGAVRPVRGSDALAGFASQMVVATASDTTRGALAFAAAVLKSTPVFSVEVGDDPATLARAIDRLFAPARATGSTSGDRP